MPNKENDIKDILRLLGSWITEIRLVNAISYLDINKVSESFAMKLLNLLYDYKLEDLNKIDSKYPGLDLGNFNDSKVAFQITSRVDTAKVISSLKTITARKDHQIFTGGIKFLILREGQKVSFPVKSDPTKHLAAFRVATDMVYPENLAEAVNEIYDSDDFSTFLKIKELVERELQFITAERPKDIQHSLEQLTSSFEKQFSDLAGMLRQNQQNISYDIDVNAEFPDLRVLGKRETLVTILHEKLHLQPVLWLSGVSGTGKSSLAYLTGEKFSGTKYWIDFREIAADGFGKHLMGSLCNSLQINPGPPSVTLPVIMALIANGGLLVLNDLPDISVSTKNSALLNSLIKAATDSSVCIIITSNYQPGLNFNTQFTGQFVAREIPLFTDEECAEVLIAFGAPKNVAEEYSKTVNLLAEGYPLIINTIAAYLKEQKWAIDNHVINRIFHNNYNDQLNHEIYGSVAASTEDKRTLELLYRSRVIIGSFGPKELQAIAESEPKIPHYQQKFEKLKGIWIQQTQREKYQLSPLIRRLNSNLNTSVERNVNNSLAEVLIKRKTLNQAEIIKAIQYFILGESYMDAAMLLIASIRELLDKPEIFFEWGFTLFWYYTDIPKEINAPTRIYIRFLQINICIAAKENYDDLLRDIKLILATEEVDPKAIGLSHMLFYQVLSQTEPIAAMEHLLIAYRDLPLKEIYGYAEEEANDEKFENAVWLPFCACKTEAEFADWFNQIKAINFRDSFFDPRANLNYVAAGLSVYINLIAANSLKDLHVVRPLLFKIIRWSMEAGLNLIAAYSLRNLVIILCEDLGEFNEAEDLVFSYENLTGLDPIYKFLVFDELGRQFLVERNRIKSSFYLEQVIETELPAFFTEKAVTYRKYSELTGDSDSHKALTYSLKTLDFVLSTSYFPPIEKVKLYGETGISYWLAGDLTSAVSCFEQGYDLLHKMFDDTPEHQAQVLRYGSTANYIAQLMMTGKAPTEAEEGTYSIPQRGSFYFTNDLLIASGMYNPERRYMVAHLLQVAYEFLGNYETARKWALNCIQIMLGVEDPRFSVLLHGSLFYLINDREYGKAMNVFNYIKKHYKPKTPKQPLNANDEQIKAMSEQVNQDDVVFYSFFFVPLLFKVIPDILDQQLTADDEPRLIRELFDAPSSSLANATAFTTAKELFQAGFNDYMNPFELDQKFEAYQGEYLTELKVIAYLMAGIHGSAREAANFQLSVVNRLEALYINRFSEIINLLIVPFFENFWRTKAIQCQMEFYDFEIWESESIPRWSQERGLKKVKNLFKTLNYHLGLDMPQKLTDWVRSK